MEADMKKFIGIDLYSNNSVVVVSDEEDRVIFQKRMANDLKLIEMALAPHRDETVGVVVESTYNWYWLVDGLMDAGYRVHLANPSGIRKYEGLKFSGDVADAAYACAPAAPGVVGAGLHLSARGAWSAGSGARSACNWCATAAPRFGRSKAS
jgi:transposase